MNRRKIPVVFVDRDGVLNRSAVVDGKPYAPRRFADFLLLPGVRAALGRLRRAGYAIAVVTNQPDLGNGLVAPAEIRAMHGKLLRALRVDGVWTCPHRQDAGCPCRKPRPGLLAAAAAVLDADRARSWMVGDRNSDIAAGRDFGIRTAFVDRRYGESAANFVRADARAFGLPGIVAQILRRPRRAPRIPAPPPAAADASLTPIVLRGRPIIP